MSAISSITESWNGHTFQEVETHIKGNYLPLTSVSVSSISSDVANVLTLNSSNAVKKTSLSDLASLLGGWNWRGYIINDSLDNISENGFYVGADTAVSRPGNYWFFLLHFQSDSKAQIAISLTDPGRNSLVYVRSYAASAGSWTSWKEL